MLGDISDKVKIKDCAADCANGSMSYGIIKTSSVCCNTDRCNILDAPGIVLYSINANGFFLRTVENSVLLK